jgi:predicted aldo/keto reductase-like oxidoreductase
LTFGAGGAFMDMDEDTWPRVLKDAIGNGVVYLDTAHAYGAGKCEERIGQLMPEHRKDVLIQTKIRTRDKNEWWAHFELSLKRLRAEYVDMLLIHSLQEDDDLTAIEAPGGPLELLYKAKEQRLARWIGISSHVRSSTLITFLRRHKVDAIQVALNVATGAQHFLRDQQGPYETRFRETTLPVATDLGLGITVMKVLGAGLIANQFERFDSRTCLRYALSFPVTAASIGMATHAQFKENLDVVRRFEPYSPQELRELTTAAEPIKTVFNNFMATHHDVA